MAIVYLIAGTANMIPEFRYCIREGKVIEHDVVQPSTTILTGEDLFSFCLIEYCEDFPAFAAKAAEQLV